MNKKKLIIPIVASIETVGIITGVTYAYFSARVTEENKTETIIKTNTLGLTYTGELEINESSMIPGDSFTKTFKVENTSNIAVTYNIYMENVLNEFDEDLVYTLTDETGKVIEETALPETKDGKTYLKTNISIDAESTKTYTLKVEYKYLDTPQNAYQGKVFNATVGIDTEQIKEEISDDCEKINNRVICIGDELQFGSETFYVYNPSDENGNIRMLSKYNLEVGNSETTSHPADIETYLQSERAIGYHDDLDEYYATVAFSSFSQKGENYSSYEGSIVQGYVNGYKDKLTELGVNVEEATLITKEELETLGCDSSNSECSSSDYSWVYKTSYWTRSAYDRNNVWNVDSNGRFNYADFNYAAIFGVRPVIVISKSSI